VTAPESDYPPHGERYEGPVVETGRGGADLDPLPIASLVSVYHSGKSDEHLPSTAVPVAADEPETGAGPSTLQKIGSIFVASTRRHEDFPHSGPFEGALSELHRRPEHRSEPLEPVVSVYHHGQSDDQRPPTAASGVDKTDMAEAMVEKRQPEKLSTKVGSLFVSSGQFPPTTPAYEGPVGDLTRSTEIGALPLDSRVAVHRAVSLEEQAALTPAPASEADAAERPRDGGSTLGRRITSIFKRPAMHDDFPISEPYTGEQMALGTADELPAEALTARVSAYHPGRSDEGPTRTALIEEHEKKPAADPLARITSMFAAKTAPDDGYPERGPAYEGPLQQLEKRPDVDSRTLSTLVSAYHLSGRSDERPPKRPEEEAEEQKAPALKKKSDFPYSEPFKGPLGELVPRAELTDERIDSRVAIYHTTGRSDQQPVEVAPPAAHAEKKHETLGRFASLFGTRKASIVCILINSIFKYLTLNY
jgi:hypothetical protein